MRNRGKSGLCVTAAVIRFFICFITVSFASPSFADVADDPNARFVRVARQISPEAINVTPHFAIVREQADPRMPADVWVPGELLAQMNVPVKLNDAKNSFTIRIDSPSKTLAVPVLRTLSPNAVDLEFRARSEDNRQYFNLCGMEKVTGLSYAVTQQNVLVVGATSLMPDYLVNKKNTPPSLPGLQKPFNLVWDHVIGENSDLSAEDPLPGVSVISPTWFALIDEKGRASNGASASYVASAHSKGYRVWALVSNGFKKEMTRKFLADKKAQDAFISRILAYASIYGLDGINIDFESVANDDAPRLTAFVRRFAETGRTLGLTFSVDVMVPTKWTRCYERTALSKIADYIAVMTYDEHWRTSPKAGSTASLPWVSAKLTGTLAEIPASRLLMGIPLYTREWEETSSSAGKVSVKSRALSMTSVDERLETTASRKQWLGEKGQHYFEYENDGRKYRIWVEDEDSMALRMALVKKHDLAGAAFWRKGFEKLEIWDQVGKLSKQRDL
jgi:spore germination protein YaaH